MPVCSAGLDLERAIVVAPSVRFFTSQALHFVFMVYGDYSPVPRTSEALLQARLA